MKVVMVNDCAFVGETLLKYLPSDIAKRHIKRRRNFWSKTFGLANDILRAKADIYHVNYLLQDCYIAAQLGKHPLIGHAHGSDLRVSLGHFIWGKIVRSNLSNCDKVIVSTPDILGIAEKLREGAEYLPNPVDTELFYPKPFRKHDGKKNVLIASDSNWIVKGTDAAIKALGRIKTDVDVSIIEHGLDFNRTVELARFLGLHLNILPKVAHEKLNEYYWNADVVVDQFNVGSLGMVSLEAIACGRPVITYASSEYSAHIDFPLKDVKIPDRIIEAIEGSPQILWEEEYNYLLKYHHPIKVAKRIMEIYLSLLENVK